MWGVDNRRVGCGEIVVGGASVPTPFRGPESDKNTRLLGRCATIVHHIGSDHMELVPTESRTNRSRFLPICKGNGQETRSPLQPKRWSPGAHQWHASKHQRRPRKLGCAAACYGMLQPVGGGGGQLSRITWAPKTPALLLPKAPPSPCKDSTMQATMHAFLRIAPKNRGTALDLFLDCWRRS